MTKEGEKRSRVALPKQNRLLGWILSGSGLLLFVMSIIPAMVANTDVENDWFYMLLFIFMFGGGAYAIVRGKRHLTPVKEWTWVYEQSFPILYLRSFDAERNDYDFSYIFSAFRNAFGRRYMSFGSSWWMPTFQAQLAMMMNRIGTYVAIGKPGENLPGMGAVRCYIGDDWEERVCKLLSKAGLVVLRAGTTEGLSVEIEHCKVYLQPAQLLVILPFQKEDYSKIRALLLNKHAIEIPEKQSNGMLVRFGNNWDPIPLQPEFSLDKTLESYFVSNGIDPPKVRWWDSIQLFFR